MESKHVNYLKIREVWHLGFPWGPQWLEGQAGTPRPLPTFCPPVWGMALPPAGKAQSQHQIVSLLFPPKRAVSLLIWNFQLIRHQAPVQRLSKCSEEEKKNQPNNSERTIPVN